MNYIVTFRKPDSSIVESFLMFDGKSVRNILDRFETANPGCEVVGIREQGEG